MSKQAVGYIRVSTEGQAVDGVSLEAQQSKIQAWCLANDFQLSDCYVDAGISGSRADNRPELQHAIDRVVASSQALVVYSLSRLARSTKDTILISEKLDKAGCDLVSLSEKIDTTSAAGKMVFRMLAVLAEFERDLISERTIVALAHKRAQGKRVGGIPFGWDIHSDGQTLVEVPEEQDALSQIQELHSQGCSLRQIARALQDKNVRTKSGRASWSAKVVRGILRRNPQLQSSGAAGN